MAGKTRSIYVISDLHIGGDYGDPNAEDASRKRGFRMMKHSKELAAFVTQLTLEAPVGTELVINGDFIDFLAEQHEGARFRPFLFEPRLALETFEKIVLRDQPIFEALAGFCGKGNRLTILLGNHDVELSLPDVRAALVRTLAVSPGTLRFVYDGEALVYGDALIEHGNAYDPANVVNHEGLTRVRGLRSRGFTDSGERFFTPPPGSQLVASVMNPIKSEFGFIDLLKPESEPLFALLLAIAPQYRKELGKAALALKGVAANLMPRVGVPNYLANVSAVASGPGSFEENVAGGLSESDRALQAVLTFTVGDQAAQQLIDEAKAAEAFDNEQPVASLIDRARAGIGLVRLFLNGDKASLEQRIELVQSALLALDGDQSFADDVETGGRYLEAAEALSESGYRYIVFGHTHHAKDVALKNGARYFNTGTWANLMRFPAELLAGTDKDPCVVKDPSVRDERKAVARKALLSFVKDIANNALDEYITFRPTYVRLDLEDEKTVVRGELRTFNADGPLWLSSAP